MQIVHGTSLMDRMISDSLQWNRDRKQIMAVLSHSLTLHYSRQEVRVKTNSDKDLGAVDRKGRLLF